MNKNIFLLVISLVLGSLVLVACGTGSPSDYGFPSGKFVWSESEFVGIYLNEDKTWSGFYYGEEVAKGTYDVKGNLYTQTSDAPDLTAECAVPATYEWSFDGINLAFKLHGEDACDIRRESFDGQTFILTQ